MNARLEQIKRFLARHGWGDAELRPLAGDASFRRYIRLVRGDRTLMLMDAPPEKETVLPYLAIARHLAGHGYSAPAVVAADEEAGLLLLEDLGDDLFTAVLKKNSGDGALERRLYEAAIDLLAEWHHRRGALADPVALPLPAYDEDLLLKEASLFCDWYLPQLAGKEGASALRDEYLALWQNILAAAPLDFDRLVHRDYHADNLIWLPGRAGAKNVGLLDFQDGVYGDAAYDMVSLLEDARRDVPAALAEDMLARYLAATGAPYERFMAAYRVLGAQRNSKIVGIFVRLAARDGKSAYLQFLPRVWRHLERDLAHPSLAPLKTWLDRNVPADARGVIAIKNSATLARTA